MKELLQFLLVIIIILIPQKLAGQDEITIKGTVTDKLGNPLI